MPGNFGIYNLIKARSILDFQAVPTVNLDQGPAINNCIVEASQDANGLVIVPPGAFYILTPIQVLSNITLVGYGSASQFISMVGSNGDLMQIQNAVNVRIKDLQLNGNRANVSGNGNGIYIFKVDDSWLDNVEILSCVADGIAMDQGERIKVRDCRISNNGRHGVSLNFSDYCRFTGVESRDNGKQGTAGTGDGFNLDLLSHHNQFLGCDGWESSLAGTRQGYGFREVSGGGCYKNFWVGGNCEGNLTAPALVEPNSIFMSYIQLMSGGMGLGTATPNATALLDMVSVQQGLGLPSMTTVQRNDIVSPRAGLTIYNSTTNKINVFTGSVWEAVTSA